MPQDETNTESSLTPMMRQYYELKEQAGSAILFFRMGDFFEIFDKDAELVAPMLELTLTARGKSESDRIPFCGVPHHAARNYWLKLLAMGFKVAIAEQVEDPSASKGLVKRDITRTFTPGCIDELEGLTNNEPNYIMAIHEDPTSHTWAMLISDVSTGELRLGNLDSIKTVAKWVERIRPKEILARKFFHDDLAELLNSYLSDHQLLIEALPEAALRDETDHPQMLQEIFGKKDLTSQMCGAVLGGRALVASFISHLKQLNASLSQFMAIRPLHEPDTMALSEIAIRDLELFETSRRRQLDGSLLKQINQTLSPMGARLLRYQMVNPLLNKKLIRGRHSAIKGLLALGEIKLTDVRKQIKNTPDLERLVTRIFSGRASPVELARTRDTLEKAQWIMENLTGKDGSKVSGDIFKSVASGLNFYKRPLRLLEDALVENPTSLGSEDGIFKHGYHTKLDQLVSLAKNGTNEVEKYQDQLREETGIASLKIKPHKTFGLLIEVTKSNLAKVPSTFIRRQTMVNNERFVTPELKELDETLSSARELSVSLELEVYNKLLLDISKFRLDLQSTAGALATFDMLQSFAWQALKQDYCEPKLTEQGALDLKGARHPVVEHFVGRYNFVPNDLTLSQDQKHALITGPNMAGKSTVMRQTAICAILCQMGSFVPAKSAKMPIFDQIFTRVGAGDDLAKGQSTFMVEMAEAAEILRKSTQSSLVILDEVGRGTSTQDGLAIASAILEELVLKNRCFSMFATHYHELVPMADKFKSVKIMQTEVKELEGQITFTHKLIDGASGSSFGIEVAKIAGIPQSVIERAQDFVEEAAHTQDPKPTASLGHPERSGAVSTHKDSSSLSKAELNRLRYIAEKFERLNPDRMTPIQALNFIVEIRSKRSSVVQTPLFSENSV